MIQHGSVVKVLEEQTQTNLSGIEPPNESQARELNRLPDDAKAPAWREIREKSAESAAKAPIRAAALVFGLISHS